jgi:flavin reductase (DIM6/NTAB) family NADH-FMN oxidoreductase RutF
MRVIPQSEEAALHIEPQGLSTKQVYNLLYGCVVPRPIAWVTTRGPDGTLNVAPYSAFTVVSVTPPMVLISCGFMDGQRKDTARNIAATGEFCVNIVSRALLEPMHASSADFPADLGEVDALGLETAPSHAIGTPRIAAAPAALECRLHQILKFGAHSESIVGEVVAFHFAEGICEKGRVDQQRLGAMGRIGGPTYVTAGEFISLPPPVVPAKD